MRSGTLTTETTVLLSPVCRLVSTSQTGSASLTPGTDRIASRSSSVISMVETASVSQSS